MAEESRGREAMNCQLTSSGQDWEESTPSCCTAHVQEAPVSVYERFHGSQVPELKWQDSRGLCFNMPRFPSPVGG